MPPVGFEPTIAAGERPQPYAFGQARTETQETQPAQGRAAQVSVIHTFEYVSAS
jgi:hypothetical protein